MDQLSKEDLFRNHVGDDILYVVVSFCSSSDAQHVQTSGGVYANGIETHIGRVDESARFRRRGEGERAIPAYWSRVLVMSR